MLEGNTFVVSDLAGNIAASPTDTLGLFAWDTRHLSRWVLTVNGQTLNPLSTDAIEYYATQFFLVPGGAARDAAPASGYRVPGCRAPGYGVSRRGMSRRGMSWYGRPLAAGPARAASKAEGEGADPARGAVEVSGPASRAGPPV